MSDRELPIYHHIFALEYTRNGSPLDAWLGDVAMSLCDRVVRTACNRLVRQRSPHTFLSEPLEKVPPHFNNGQFDIAVISCSVPGEAAPPAVHPMIFNSHLVAEKRLSRPDILASACLRGAAYVLGEAGLYNEISNTYLAGSEPRAHEQLLEDLAGLPAFSNSEVPRTAEEFADSISDISNAVFGEITGGVIPRITTEVLYAELRL